MSEITAQLNYLRIAPRKVRAVTQLLKGLDVDLAQAQLKYITRRPVKPLLKLLNSAISNAKHLGLDKNYLYVKEIIVNEGMKLKRYKPKGFGLAMPIQKKTSRIKIILGELAEEKRRRKEEMMSKIKKLEIKKPKEVVKEKEEKKEIKAEKQKVEKKIEKVSKKGAFGGIKQLGRRLFRRKSI